MAVLLLNVVNAASSHVAHASPPANPAPFPSPIPSGALGDETDPDKKGTIGLICVDTDGHRIGWQRDNADADARLAFELCLRNVLGRWEDERIENKRVDMRALNFNEWMGGYRRFKELTEGVRVRRLYGPSFVPINDL